MYLGRLMTHQKKAGRIGSLPSYLKNTVPRKDNLKYETEGYFRYTGNGWRAGDGRSWRRETGITDRHIIGVLTAVIRDGQKLPVTDKRYQLYVHLWCDLFYLRAVVLWCRDLPGRIKRKLCQ